MPEYAKTAEECSHDKDSLHYHGMDVGEPGVVYENWCCEDCGAGVDIVYEPQHRIIHPRNGDVHTEEMNTDDC